MQFGAKGVSFLSAAGDSGVGPTDYCVSNNGSNAATFLPMFPASCPYVTAVGGTKNFNPEVVALDTANGYRSGGGFSYYFPRPAYQNINNVVTNYIKNLNGSFAGLYNQNGRGYPDVAAQSQRFVTIWDGRIVILDGTSAATPTFSSIVALVNDYLLSKKKKPLGFLNPLLYAYGYRILTDITSGSAIGCGTTGFPAVKGWDAVSGFGTPELGKLQSQAMAAQK